MCVCGCVCAQREITRCVFAVFLHSRCRFESRVNLRYFCVNPRGNSVPLPPRSGGGGVVVVVLLSPPPLHPPPFSRYQSCLNGCQGNKQDAKDRDSR